MDHFDEVAGAIRANVGHARGAIDLGGDGFQDGAQGLPGLGRPTGHDGRAVQGAFLAAGNASADEVLAALGHFLFAANGIRKQRIAAIDDDVAVIHGIGKLIDDRIGGLARLHHDDGLAGALQGSDEIRDGLGRNKVSFVTVGLNEGVGLFRAAIIDGDGIAIAGKVAS